MSTGPDKLPGQIGEYFWHFGARCCIVVTPTEVRLGGLLSERIATRDGERVVPDLPGDAPCTLAYRALYAAGLVRYEGERDERDRPVWRVVGTWPT